MWFILIVLLHVIFIFIIIDPIAFDYEGNGCGADALAATGCKVGFNNCSTKSNGCPFSSGAHGKLICQLSTVALVLTAGYAIVDIASKLYNKRRTQ